MYITALPCHLHAVFMTRFVNKGHAHRLINLPQLQLPLLLLLLLLNDFTVQDEVHCDKSIVKQK